MTTLKAACSVLPKAQSFRLLNKYQKISLLQNHFEIFHPQRNSTCTLACGYLQLQSVDLCRTFEWKFLNNSILKKSGYKFTCCQSQSMSGHSKWQNIRHNKAAQDAQKSRIASKLTSKIRVAIKENGSSDPKTNIALARVIAEAKANDISASKIENTIKGATSSQDSGSLITMEAKGPCGSWLLIETFTDKVPHLRQELTSLVKKHGGSIGDTGFAMHSFQHIGVIEVAMDDGEKVDMDKYLEVAIDVGAEDVTIKTNEHNRPYLEFICDPMDLKIVYMSLEKLKFNVTSSDAVYVAPNPTQLEEENNQLLTKLIQKLQDHPEVIRVFDNVVLPD